MSVWRRKALEAFPESRTAIQSCDSPVALWIELEDGFDSALKNSDPEAASRFFEFARWCRKDSKNEDVATAAWTVFYEHLPKRKRSWSLVAALITSSEFHELSEAFQYLASEHEFEEFVAYYKTHRKPPF